MDRFILTVCEFGRTIEINDELLIKSNAYHLFIENHQNVNLYHALKSTAIILFWYLYNVCKKNNYILYII